MPSLILHPGNGTLDVRGGNYTYDGHNAIDFTLPRFAAMDADVSARAAASGTVALVHDGQFDRCSRVNPCGDNPNYVVIDHGNSVFTEYLHLKKDSILVGVGETAGRRRHRVGLARTAQAGWSQALNTCWR